ncbi:DUF4038 domain-containing protein [Cohnella fermenti]|uniref:DUF4038 domain-containing protein n=1 Tax=Cohnella fermenti TaxID=2565925 RepID=A0A4S4BPF8_9BACL|nr:DUF4038 domain-containing protein [Cohnella fermenti]
MSENRRFLVYEDESPFFWLGDTAWELFHRLSREDAELYLTTRAAQGFTVVQAVALAELDGLTKGNAYDKLPLTQSAGRYDCTRPDVRSDYNYWDHVDFVVDRAEELGIYIAFLPTWGDKFNRAWGTGPEIFDPANAELYGRWLGERYKERANILWVLGGDRPLVKQNHFEVIAAMAAGLKEGDGGRHLITFHPDGEQSSSLHVHDQPWLDFNMIQSSHGLADRDNYKMVAKDYALEPVKPTLDAEPCYEDHPRGFNAVNGYFDEADVRRVAYYAVFAGAFGHTYGHHAVWSMTTEPSSYFINDWKSALQKPGAAQMKHLRALMESRPFLDRVPDQTLLNENHEGANYAVATRGESYAYCYSPNGLTLKVALEKIQGEEFEASWFDPRTGEFHPVGTYPNRGEQAFTPPSSGRGNDWVLVLDSK